jgi:hypothetical protein
VTPIVLYSHTLVGVHIRRQSYFCECRGTGITNHDEIVAFDEMVAARREFPDPGLAASGPPPKEIKCPFENSHSCANCGTDIYDVGIELTIEVAGIQQLGLGLRKLTRCFCTEGCLIDEYGVAVATNMMRDARIIAGKENKG